MKRSDQTHDRDGVAEANGWRVIKLGERNVGRDCSDSQCDDTGALIAPEQERPCAVYLRLGRRIRDRREIRIIRRDGLMLGGGLLGSRTRHIAHDLPPDGSVFAALVRRSASRIRPPALNASPGSARRINPRRKSASR